MNSFLQHYGVGHLQGGHSGRYPYGSGDEGYQRGMDFMSRYNRLIADNPNMSEKELAKALGCLDKYGHATARAFRNQKQLAGEQIKTWQVTTARRMFEEGKTNTEIAEAMGVPNSTVRGWTKEGSTIKLSASTETAMALKKLADSKDYVDISDGAETYLGVTKNRLENAKYKLMGEGYGVYTIKVPQLGTNNMTTITVLAKPGIEYGEVVENRFDIKPVYDESKVVNSEGVVTALGISKDMIHSVSSDRVKVVYNEEGGLDKDGLIELRKGVDDISIGTKAYAQVRIPVDETHYIKGMAVYSDNLPPGIDIVFNTNKHLGTPMTGDKDNTVLKPMKTKADGSIDWDNPFGAAFEVKSHEGKDGKEILSSCCIVNEEGKWMTWSKNLPSQFLSKQPLSMAKRQLEIDAQARKEEFEAINSLTNPTIKKQLLIDFAETCDKASYELKGAPLPGQQSHVLIPDPRIGEKEIYAPNYPDGTKVALIRYPHSGTFEIPVLTVKNKGSIGESIIGKNAPDAVVISKPPANQLSGADFDGDTVTIIPLSDKVRVNHRDTLEGLKDFDPSERYPKYDGMPVIKSQTKQTEMGKVTNLIMDMTLQGAPEDDLVKAVRHSMVIIDAEKHELDWKRSEQENDIADLKRVYQMDAEGHVGAGTIISRAKSQLNVDERKQWTASYKSINPETGEKIYTYTDATYTKVKLKGEKVKDPTTGKSTTVYPEGTDESGWIGTYKDKSSGQLYYTKLDTSTGKKVRVYLEPEDYTSSKTEKRTQESKRLLEATDAFTVTSGGSKENPGYPMEKVYATYSNEMKALANLARKTWLQTKEDKRDPEATKEYAAEVASLGDKLKRALAHAPLERQAQLMANRTMAIKRHDNPDMSKDQVKKYKQQAIDAARKALGVKKKNSLIEITDREWEAIQHKAISPTTLRQILRNTDADKLRERATPRNTKQMSPSQIATMKAMANSGYSNEQIAERLGVSPSTVYKKLGE